MGGLAFLNVGRELIRTRVNEWAFAGFEKAFKFSCNLHTGKHYAATFNQENTTPPPSAKKIPPCHLQPGKHQAATFSQENTALPCSAGKTPCFQHPNRKTPPYHLQAGKHHTVTFSQAYIVSLLGQDNNMLPPPSFKTSSARTISCCVFNPSQLLKLTVTFRLDNTVLSIQSLTTPLNSGHIVVPLSG